MHGGLLLVRAMRHKTKDMCRARQIPISCCVTSRLELTELLYPDGLMESIDGLSESLGTYNVNRTGRTTAVEGYGEDTTTERAIAIARASLADNWAGLLVIPGALARLPSVTRSGRSG